MHCSGRDRKAGTSSHGRLKEACMGMGIFGVNIRVEGPLKMRKRAQATERVEEKHEILIRPQSLLLFLVHL